MAAIQWRKREMVRELRKIDEEHTKASSAELIYGLARFVAPHEAEIELRDGDRRKVREERVFSDLCSITAWAS